jgi:hypothetical protein
MKITKTQLKQIIKEELEKTLSEDFTYHSMSPCEEQASRDAYGRLEHGELDVEPWSHWTDEQRALFPRGYTWSRADRRKCRETNDPRRIIFDAARDRE